MRDNTDVTLTVLGSHIRQQREAAGLTQAVLADKVGCTRSSIANIEAGRQDTTVTRLAAIADALHVRPGDLLPRGDGDAMRRLSLLLAENARLRAVISGVKSVLENAEPTEWREAAAKIRGDRTVTIIVNPGARLGNAQNANGWTNTYATARATAEEWLVKMLADGIADVEISAADETERDGRWTFTFRHAVTGIEVELETHGIDDIDAYRRQNIFDPRVYWCGSSTSNPSLEDFAAPGYVMTFREVRP